MFLPHELSRQRTMTLRVAQWNISVALKGHYHGASECACRFLVMTSIYRYCHLRSLVTVIIRNLEKSQDT